MPYDILPKTMGLSMRFCPYSQVKGFGLHWTDGWTQRFSAVLSQADLVKYICPGYSPACFQIRNEWMVNHSNRIIIAYNGEKGGTKNTIDYAQNHSECECVFLPMER
jgi:uncharacterized phage-like protein YoqJ